MKRFTVLLMLVVLIGFAQVALAQEKVSNLKPNLPYGRYTIAQVWDSASADNSKAIAFKNFLLEKTKQPSLKKAKRVVKIKTTTLVAGKYKNSGWNPQTGKFDFFLGKQWTGRVWYYMNGADTVDLIKFGTLDKEGKPNSDICANLLESVIKKDSNLSEDDKEYQPDTVKAASKPKHVTITPKGMVCHIDTGSKQIFYHDTLIYVNTVVYIGDGINYSYVPSPTYYPTYSCAVSMGWGWNYYDCGSCFYHDYGCHVTNNNYSNNYYNTTYTWNTGGRVTPPPHVDPGGRVTPPSHTDGTRTTPPSHTELGRRVTSPSHTDGDDVYGRSSRIKMSPTDGLTKREIRQQERVNRKAYIQSLRSSLRQLERERAYRQPSTQQQQPRHPSAGQQTYRQPSARQQVSRQSPQQQPRHPSAGQQQPRQQSAKQQTFRQPSVQQQPRQNNSGGMRVNTGMARPTGGSMRPMGGGGYSGGGGHSRR